jgi:cytochrome P450
VVNVLAGGIDTTQSQLAHALRLFAGHPEQWALLGRRPELVPQAVSEVLRFEPITPFTARLCVEQVEHRGVAFPAGTIVAICAERAYRELPAAAHGHGARASDAHGDGQHGDGAQDDDAQGDPERFDITVSREDRLLTFGAGPHYCLGANLARAELEEALMFLAPRMPGLAVDGVAELGGVEGIYGINTLPLRWTGAAAGADQQAG